jgi:hypothetical protein
VRKMLSSSSARKRLRSLSTRRPSTQAHPDICPMGNREAGALRSRNSLFFTLSICCSTLDLFFPWRYS